VRLAWAAAGLDPAAPGSLGLLEAHGTGTPNGDGAEMATLAEVFGRSVAPDAVIGSVKSMIGHTMPAAGVAGLIKAALAIHRGVLLPTLHCEDPHPALLETRFRPAGQARPWEGEVRRAGVNAFGFGGINAHVVLEGMPEPAQVTGLRPGPRSSSAGGAGFAEPVHGAEPAHDTGLRLGSRSSDAGGAGSAEPVHGAEPSHVAGLGAGPRSSDAGGAGFGEPIQVAEPLALLRLAARTPAELAELLDADDATVRALPAAGEDAGPSRVAILDPNPRRLALARKAAAQGRAWGGRSDVWMAPEPLLGPGGGKTAFLFPGLEADFEPRADDVAAHFGLSRPDWQDARVGDVAEHGAAVVGLGRLLADALARTGVAPDAVAGHSVGEWTAMVVGGMFDDAEVDAFLRDFDPSVLRVPGLAFAAFGAPAQQVEAELPAFPGVVLSHDNAPRQSIACGPRDQVEALADRLRGEGVLGQVLPFESGFHTPMLAPYLGPIEQASLGFTLSRSRVPVWSGTTMAPFPADDASVRALFLRHLLEPVRFRGLTRSLYDAGFRAFVQLGTGQLPALVGDTLADAPHLALTANSPRHSGLSQLLRVAAGLWTYGATPDFGALTPTSARPAPQSARPAFEDRGRRPNRGARGEAPGRPQDFREGAGWGTEQPQPTHAIPIKLGSALISLDETTRNDLRTTLRGPLATSIPAAHAQGELAAVAAKFPAAAELQALLTETAQTAAALFAAAP
ncbi:acyltransferase domain-containing protein, partial [Streptomyces sp. T-3]|nr:acyltransferase domain-containing protein [Streptomyces sp. T-3]